MATAQYIVFNFFVLPLTRSGLGIEACEVWDPHLEGALAYFSIENHDFSWLKIMIFHDFLKKKLCASSWKHFLEELKKKANLDLGTGRGAVHVDNEVAERDEHTGPHDALQLLFLDAVAHSVQLHATLLQTLRATLNMCTLIRIC